MNLSTPASKTDRRVGLFIYLGVLCFYLLLMPGFPVPGRWALIASSFSGLEPFRPLMRPLWTGVTALLAKLPVANYGLVLQVFSALIGAGVCWLVFEVVRRISFARLMRRVDQDEVERISRRFGGVVAALFVAVSLPVLKASTRGDYVAWDLLLALAAILPFMVYANRPHPVLVYGSLFLAGLAVVEYPGMLVVLPLLLAGWGFRFFRQGWPPVRVIVIGVICLVAGLVTLPVYLAAVLKSPMAGWLELATYGDVWRGFLEVYQGELMHSVPKVGWLLILGMNMLPLLLVVARELDEPSDLFTGLGVYTFRIALVALAVMTLFELPGSPQQVAGGFVPLLSPSVVVAVWFGFLVGYYDQLWRRSNKVRLRRLVRATLLVMLVAAGVLHARAASTAGLAPVAAFADEVVTRMGDRTFLVTDGTLDDPLRLAARKAGKELHLINVMHNQKADRGRYLASLFEDPGLMDMARLGVAPLLNDWLRNDSQAADTLAFLVVPDVAERAGFLPVPDAVLYRLEPSGYRPDAQALLDGQMPFWTSRPSANEADGTMRLADPAEAACWFVSRWMSRLANDTGVLLEDQEEHERATAAFKQALSLWPDNISATVNLLEQARRVQNFAEDDAMREQLDAVVERNRSRFHPRMLARLGGRIRATAARLEEASALNVAGQADLAEERIQQAAALISGDDVAAQLSLARLYLREQDLDGSELAFRHVLERHPEDVPAHTGLLRVALRRRDFDEATRRLEALAALEADPVLVKLELANLLMAMNRMDEALVLLKELTQQEPAPLDAWYGLALIARNRKDEALRQQAGTVLAQRRGYMPGMLLLGDEALRRGQFREARTYLEQALALAPANRSILERLILIDYHERDAAALRRHAGAMLALEPDDPVGLFGSASVHIAAQRYDLAEVPLRRCLEVMDYGPARNDLAWILSHRGEHEDALKHAQRAVELLDGDASALDTLAMIYLALGRTDEAGDAIGRALELPAGQSIPLLLHAAIIYRAAGSEDLVQPLLKRLTRARSLLDRDQQRQLDELAAGGG